MDKEEVNKEAEYFTKLLGAGDSKTESARSMINTYFQQMTFVNFILITKLMSNLDSSDLKTNRLFILDTITNNIRSQIDKEAKQHTDMCEGSTLGSLFSGVIGDGEDFRLKANKALKTAEECLRVAIEESTDNEDAS